MKIPAYWQLETGRFDTKLNTFTDRKLSEITECQLPVKIEPSNYSSDLILRFLGGPTGYESYYLTDIEQNLSKTIENREFYICAGTINSWPCCWVKTDELKKIINFYKEKEV